MSLILVVRGQRGGAFASRLETRLLELGFDVCIAPNEQAARLRTGVLRSLSSQSMIVTAAWSEDDFADPALRETLIDAALQGKLVGASADGSAFPHIEERIQSGWVECAFDLEAMVEAIAARAQPSHAHAVRDEYQAFQHASQRGDASSYARFLKHYPQGALSAFAHAEHGLAQTPRYRAQQRSFAALSWRLEGAPSFGVMVASAAGVLIAAAGLWGVVRVGGEQGLWRQNELLAARSVHAEEGVTANASGRSAPLPRGQDAGAGGPAPAQMSAAPIPMPTTGQALTASAPSSDAEVALLDRRPLEQRVSSVQTGPVVRVALPPQMETLAPEPSRQLRLQSASMRTPRPDAFDPNTIDPGLRAVVEQARRRQSYARAEATREADVRSLSVSSQEGRYRGEWSSTGANGLGRGEWSDGARYEGSWRRSRPDGMGVMHMANGIRYEGEFDNGAPTGRGVFWSADGERLSGDALFRALVEARRASAPSDAGNAR